MGISFVQRKPRRVLLTSPNQSVRLYVGRVTRVPVTFTREPQTFARKSRAVSVYVPDTCRLLPELP